MAARLSALRTGRDLTLLKKKVVGLERGPLSLVSTTEELWCMEGLGKMKKFNDLIRTRTRILPASSIVSQKSMLLRAPKIFSKKVHLSLCLTKHYGEWLCRSTALVGGEWSASRLGRFNHWWLGKLIQCFRYRESNFDPSARSQSLHRLVLLRMIIHSLA
jgi:hypothetical protein